MKVWSTVPVAFGGGKVAKRTIKFAYNDKKSISSISFTVTEIINCKHGRHGGKGEGGGGYHLDTGRMVLCVVSLRSSSSSPKIMTRLDSELPDKLGTVDCILSRKQRNLLHNSCSYCHKYR